MGLGKETVLLLRDLEHLGQGILGGSQLLPAPASGR